MGYGGREGRGVVVSRGGHGTVVGLGERGL